MKETNCVPVHLFDLVDRHHTACAMKLITNMVGVDDAFLVVDSFRNFQTMVQDLEAALATGNLIPSPHQAGLARQCARIPRRGVAVGWWKEIANNAVLAHGSSWMSGFIFPWSRFMH